MKSNRLAAFGLVAGLLGGGAAGLAFGVPGLAGAQTDESTTTTETPATAARGQWMRDALAPLVEQGTISQSQADAVISALEEARPARGPHGPGHRGFGGAGLEAAAGALGLSVDDLRTALEGGQSVADVARSKNIDPQTVIDAVVAEMRTHIQEKVTEGRLTQAQADEMLAGAAERAAAFVNGEGRPFGPGGPGGRHRHGDPGDAPAATGAEPSSITTA